MLRCVLFFGLLLLAGAGVQPASATSIYQPLKTGRSSLYNNNIHRQSFIALTDSIATIGGFIEDVNPHLGPDIGLGFRVRTGDGISGGVIFSDSAHFAPGFAGYADFDVSTLTFTVGQSYTFEYYSTNGGRGSVSRNQHSYSNGTLINPPDYTDGDYFINSIRYTINDMTFRIISAADAARNDEQAGVPLPPLAGLLILAAATLRRRIG